MAQPVEFWVISVPQDAAPGASLRLLDVTATEATAKAAVGELPSDIVGRVAVLQRQAMFDRQLAVQTVESETPVKGTQS